jgi:hypothetical protein
MTISPKQLTVPVGQNANVNVSEANYAGQWTANSKNANVATVTLNSQNGTFHYWHFSGYDKDHRL